MAHVEKYNVAQVGHMLNHYGRQADTENECNGNEKEPCHEFVEIEYRRN